MRHLNRDHRGVHVSFRDKSVPAAAQLQGWVAGLRGVDAGEG